MSERDKTSCAVSAATRDHSLAATDAGGPGMVERVAAALARRAGLVWEHMGEDEISIEESRAYWRPLARTAIEVMRGVVAAHIIEPYSELDDARRAAVQGVLDEFDAALVQMPATTGDAVIENCTFYGRWPATLERNGEA